MRRGRVYAVGIVLASACAAAGQADPGSDARGADATAIDTSSAIDGSVIDAAPVTATLSQTTGATVGSNNSVACGNNDGSTNENSWYRVFRLADSNIVGGFHVTAVTFGVQEANGLAPVQVKIGTYAGNVMPPPATLDTGLVTPLNTAMFSVPNTVNTAPATVTVPITGNVPALSQLIVEIFAPNYSGTGKYFYLGGNNLGESKPGYLRAPNGICATPQPATTASLGFPMSNLVITVSGTH